MMFWTRLRRLVNRTTSKRAHATPRRPGARSFRPQLQALEERCLPTIPGLFPYAVPDFYVMPANTTLNQMRAGVMTNDIDGSLKPYCNWFTGPSYGYSAAVRESNPSNGVLTWSWTGEFTYTPRADFTGVDSFSYHLETDYCVSNPSGGGGGSDYSNSTIVTITVLPADNQPLPALTINDVTLAEGNAGSTNAIFTVTLSEASSQTVSVSYTTANESAVAGSDYGAVSGTLSFVPGEMNKSVIVPVNGDTMYELDETFLVNLSGATNATIADGQARGTVTNDDSQPTISINDVTLQEGNNGTTPFVFTVSLSNASYQTITVNYATADGTAKAGSDYQATSGTLTFTSGETSKNITVLVNGDRVKESDEAFFVNLSGATNATIADAQAIATILNEDKR